MAKTGAQVETLLAVLRAPSGLVAHLYRERVAGDEVEHAIVDVPLEAWRGPLPGRSALEEAWAALAEVTILDEELLAHLLVVLRETVPAAQVDRAPPLRLPPEEAPTPAATAAHPRAFRGTRWRPARRERAAPLDLRPHVCDPRSPSLAPLLARLGHPGVPVEENRSWPASFRTDLLTSLRGSPDVESFVALHWALDLDGQLELRAIVARLAQLDAAAALRWGRRLARQPPGVRRLLGAALLATGGHSLDETRLDDAQLDRLLAGAAPEHLPRRFGALLRGLQLGASVDYLAAGFALADELQPDHDFTDLVAGRAFPLAAARAALAWLDEPLVAAYHGRAQPALLLWRHAGTIDGLAAVLFAVDWRALEDPRAAWPLFTLLLHFPYQDDPDGEKWRRLAAAVPALVAAALAVPATHRRKLLSLVEDLWWEWTSPDQLDELVPQALAVARLLCRPPFTADFGEVERLGQVLAHLVEGLGVVAPSLLELPDETWLKIERATRRQNDALQLDRGLRTLLAEKATSFPRIGLVKLGLESFPGKLLRALQVLGSLSAEHGEEVVRRLGQHPLLIAAFAPKGDPRALDNLAAADLCRRITDALAGAPAATDPIPRKLKQSLAPGGTPLSAAQLERCRRLLLDAMPALFCDLLEAAALAALAGETRIDPTDAPLRHALLLGGTYSAYRNRRAYRRFLRAFTGGQRDHVERHPATLAWLARHPRLDVARWRAGVPCVGDVTIAVESDPLEKLRMGTYVGSCLGLGGAFAYSAIAVVLDVNKQVLYARDRRGAVIARQLVAISEDDRVICFDVYPQAAAAALRALFHDFDVRLAAALDLPLGPLGGGPDYVIASILSRTWWDDGAWNPPAP